MLSPQSDAGARGAPLPVTLFCGFEGAGKSTVLKHVLDQGASRRYAVMESNRATPEALKARMHEVAAEARYDELLVELSASDDVSSVVALLPRRSGEQDSAAGPYLAALVTVIDAESFMTDFSSYELVGDRLAQADSDDMRSLADLLTEQIESADVLVLNRSNRIPDLGRRGVRALVTALNPCAALIESDCGRVPVSAIEAIRYVRPEHAQSAAGWACALEGREIPNACEYGISTLVFREHRPFHPERLMQFLSRPWPGVVRSRGCFWLATRMDWVGELSQTGPARRYRAVCTWWATTLEGKTFEPAEMEKLIGAPWHPIFGDRRQELAFVGIDLDCEELRRNLTQCLLTDEEVRRGPEVWRTYNDPFPAWGFTAIARRRPNYDA